MHRVHYQFGVLLGLIVVTIGFSLAAPEGDGARFVAVVLQAAVLVAAVVAARAHPGVIALSVAAAAVGIAGSGAALFGTGQFGNSSASVVSFSYVLLTPAAVVSGVIKHFREERSVTVQTMFGVLCLYLLIGLVFAVGFALIQEVSDADFFTTIHGERDDFLYFSYSTLSTTGYGDLVAATDLGRSLAITEALIGQLYLVTVVALIISNLRPPATRRAKRS